MHSDPRLKSSSISSLEWLLYMPHDFQVIRSLPSSFFRIECLNLKTKSLVVDWCARGKSSAWEKSSVFFFAMRKFPVRETNTKGTDILVASFCIKVSFKIIENCALLFGWNYITSKIHGFGFFRNPSLVDKLTCSKFRMSLKFSASKPNELLEYLIYITCCLRVRLFALQSATSVLG